MSAALGKSEATLSEEALREKNANRTGEVVSLETNTSSNGGLSHFWV